jgi:Rhodopirellula transposase DDE domain
VPRLAQALQAQGHQVSRTLVAESLNAAGYSLQGNRKTKEGDSHPDRDGQFAHINTQVAAALAEQRPVISVDTKKKELVGDFRNPGRPKGVRHMRGTALDQILDAKISVYHGVSGMFAASGTIIMPNEAP